MIVFHILGAVSIFLGAAPLLAFTNVNLLPIAIPQQELICAVIAVILGAVAGRKGSVLGWVGVAAGAVAFLVLIVSLFMIVAVGES